MRFGAVSEHFFVFCSSSLGVTSLDRTPQISLDLVITQWLTWRMYTTHCYPEMHLLLKMTQLKKSHLLVLKFKLQSRFIQWWGVWWLKCDEIIYNLKSEFVHPPREAVHQSMSFSLINREQSKQFQGAQNPLRPWVNWLDINKKAGLFKTQFDKLIPSLVIQWIQKLFNNLHSLCSGANGLF